jgi:acetyl-CoA acetyltransferase
LGLKPLAFIKSYADAAQSQNGSNKPIKALPKALDKAGIALSVMLIISSLMRHLRYLQILKY